MFDPRFGASVTPTYDGLPEAGATGFLTGEG